MSTFEYLRAAAALLIIGGSLAYAARTARRALLPDWTGTPALLVTTILGLALFTVLAELLGLFGALDAHSLIWTSIAAGAIAFYLERRQRRTRPRGQESGGGGPMEPQKQSGSSGPPPAGSSPFAPIAVAVLIALVVAAQWAAPTLLALDRGIYGGDSLWYHLPFAAHIAQTGSVTDLLFTDPLYLNWFYPQNAELLHGAGILLFDSDFLSPLLNLGWLGLALLAGWCIGRPREAGAATVAAVVALMSADLMFSRQPGNANNDVVAIALLLASAAILVTAAARPPAAGVAPRALLVAGLAAGLALGTKLTVAIPVAALTVGVIAIAAAGTRLRAGAAWIGGVALAGGYWYLRNLAVSGNPLPWTDLGPVSQVEELEGRDPHSIADYATDTAVWSDYFVPGLEERLGELWPLALALAVAGVVVGLLSGRPIERMLAVVAAVSAIAYVFTPLSAAGEEGAPLAFRLNIRYLAPGLALAWVLAAIPPERLSEQARRRWVWGAVAAFSLLILGSNGVLGEIDPDRLPGEALIALAVVALPAGLLLWRRRGGSRLAVATSATLAAAALLGAGYFAADDYLDQRYSSLAPHYPRPPEHPATELEHGLGAAYDWARTTSGERIALSGTEGALFQYGLWGEDSSNEVRYLGRRDDDGAFFAIADCPAYLEAVNAGGFDYLVTTPEYDQDRPSASVAPAPRAWLEDPRSGARRVTGGELVDVWELPGELDPAACGAGRPNL